MEQRTNVIPLFTHINHQKCDGGDGGNGMLEVRVAKLESDVEHIRQDVKDIKGDIREIKRDARTDFRLLFGAIITVALGLSALLAKGFHWL